MKERGRRSYSPEQFIVVRTASIFDTSSVVWKFDRYAAAFWQLAVDVLQMAVKYKQNKK